ncbi:MAG: D-aminoacyl-tRNA deacylase [Cyclobacteriaceae bacterium]
MIAVIQRVRHAKVTVSDNSVGEIPQGQLILLGIEDADTEEDIEWLSRKSANLRIFDDEEGVMNKSLIDISGEMLVVSQFTLHASTRKGNRPSYAKAARPEVAIPLYEKFIKACEQHLGKPIQTGEFGALMQIELVNDGPVTIIIDTKDRK